MQVVIGDLWDRHRAGSWVCVTTNGIVTQEGCAVMGRGNALQAAKRFTSLPSELGYSIWLLGNRPFVFTKYRIITFPVKHHWRDPADVKLIAQSARLLRSLLEIYPIKKIYLPKPGCSNGGLTWNEDLDRVLTANLADQAGRVRIIDLPK